MSLASVRERLVAAGTPVSLATLSYWRSGQREPERDTSLRALVELERMLGLLPGELEGLLPHRRRIPPPSTSAMVAEHRPALEAMFAELGLPPKADGLLVDREVTVRLDVDESRCQTKISMMAGRECTADGVDRFAWFLLHGDDEGSVDDFSSYSGFQPGRVLNSPEKRLSVTEALLEREMNRGDIALMDWSFDLSGTPEDDWLSYQVLRRTPAVTLWLRFHPDHLPAACQRLTEVDGVEEWTEVDVQPATGHTWVNFGPGIVGFRWQWPEDLHVS